MSVLTKPLLTTEETAAWLGVSPGTLIVWRCTGRYPLPFIKVGRRVMYRREDILEFLNHRTREHT
jgi:excisionase family DNA binding protein